MDRQHTVEEVLRITVDMLKGIEIPVELCERVGIPIARGIMNIQNCITAIENGKKAQEEKEQEDDPDQKG